MKALILAAGLGSRLAPLTDTLPKAMIEVNGMPILFRQIECLRQNGVNDITVVCGYLADVLKNGVHTAFPDIHIIENTEYVETNNMYSAYLARRQFAGLPFVMMNADVFFDPSVIRTLLEDKSENAVVVDIGRYLEESMKVTCSGDRLSRISKQIPPGEAFGTSIDVYKFSATGGKAFFDKCAEYIEGRKERKLWSEVALNDIFSSQPFRACAIVGRWIEIDNHADLAEAQALFASAEGNET